MESATSVSRRDAITEGHLGPILMILLAIAMALVGGIGLAPAMSANVLDRTGGDPQAVLDLAQADERHPHPTPVLRIHQTGTDR